MRCPLRSSSVGTDPLQCAVRQRGEGVARLATKEWGALRLRWVGHRPVATCVACQQREGGSSPSGKVGAKGAGKGQLGQRRRG